MMDIELVLRRSCVIPVVTVPDVDAAVAIGEALLEGGIGIIEVTLRSNAGLAAIERLRAACPSLLVGAGTVWTRAQTDDAARAGAQFVVMPARVDDVIAGCRALRLPCLPGTQTVTEIANLRELGIKAVKFFPAEPSGGVSALKAYAAVLPDVVFCPTGGITAETARDYLALACVPCVGGGWLTPAHVIAERDWRAVRNAARAAVALGSEVRD